MKFAKLFVALITLSVSLSSYAQERIYTVSQGNRIFKIFRTDDNVRFEICQKESTLFSEPDVSCIEFGKSSGYPISTFSTALKDTTHELDKLDLKVNCWNPTDKEFKRMEENVHLLHRSATARHVVYPQSVHQKLSGGGLSACAQIVNLNIDKFIHQISEIIER